MTRASSGATLRRRVAAVSLILVVLLLPIAASPVAASPGDAAQSKRFAYTVRASYAITRETVDQATSQRVSVERRLEAEFKVWASVNANQVYTRTSGDYAEVVGKAIASVRDERSSPPCAQTLETKGPIGLKFVTSRTPLTAVYLSWSSGSTRPPTVPCAAPEIERWETGARGKGEWIRVSSTLFWYESRTKFFRDVYAKLASGRNAVFELTSMSPRQQPGTTERAVVRLVFTRAAGLEPKPSGKKVVISKPSIGFRRDSALVQFAVTRGGDPTGVTRAKCTGSFAGSPGLSPPPGDSSGLSLPRVLPSMVKTWPELARVKGWVTLVTCTYELIDTDYSEEEVCGKTFRGSLRLSVSGSKTLTKRFSFPWKDKDPRTPC